jgi:hypothetical protein
VADGVGGAEQPPVRSGLRAAYAALDVAAEALECPRCGARFVTRNMRHGCGDYSVDGFFEGKPARLRELCDALVAFIGSIGPFEQVPTKSRIAFMVRVRFAGVARLRKEGSSAASG